MYNIMNIISVILSVVLIFLGLLLIKKNNKIINKIGNWFEEIVKKFYKVFILLLLLLTIFTSVFKITSLPYGLHVDEAGLAYDAQAIEKYGVDRYLRSYPIWLNNYYGSQSSMYAYLVILLIKMFGFSKLVLRMPAAIFRVLIFVFMYWILRDEKDKFKPLLFAFLFTICPYFIMQSRWALDCNLLVGFLTISECILIKSIQKDSTKLLILSGICFGLSLYTYALSFIILPLILLLTCIYLLYIKKLNFKKLVLFGIPIALLAIPLMIMLLINNGFMEEINGFITIPKLVGYRGSDLMLPNFVENAYILKSIFSADNEEIFHNVYWYNAVPEFGTIYYMTIPFFIIGFIYGIKKLVKSIKEKKFDINAIFVFWFIAVLFCMFMVKIPTIYRANAIFAPMVYFSAMGIYIAFEKVKAVIIPIGLLLTINFGMFMNFYFTEYNQKSEGVYLFATTYLTALDYVKTLKREKVYLDQLLTSEEYIYVLLDYQISPYDYDTEHIVGEYEGTAIEYNFIESGKWIVLEKESAYVAGPDEWIAQRFANEGFKCEEFGIYRVYYYESD